MRRVELIGFSSVRIAPGEAWIGKLPDEPGLYAAVLGRPFPRLAGETEILPVGQTGKTIAMPDGSNPARHSPGSVAKLLAVPGAQRP